MELNPALGVNLKDYNPLDLLSNKIWRITEKVDGVRRLFYKDNNGKVTCYTRAGKNDPYLEHINSYLELDQFPCNIIYDTELVDSDLYFSNEESFILRAMTIGKANQQFIDNKRDLAAICFDMFKPDGDLTSGEERHLLLMKTFAKSSFDAPIFHVTYYGLLDGADLTRLSHIMDGIIAQKKEGLMLMDMEAPYTHGRSNNLVKVKRVEEFAGRVVDVELAEKGTKIEGGIAALICEVPECTVPVRVGTGFTYDQRLEYAKNPPIGALIEIDAFSKTLSKDGSVSLSMPVFKGLGVSYYNHTKNEKPIGKIKSNNLTPEGDLEFIFERTS